MHLDISQEPFCAKKTGKMPQTKTAEDTLCEPWQSKCTWTFCKSSLLCENWQVKCCRPRPLTKLCASLRNRNALGCFRRAILRENFQVKWRSLCEPAWSKCNWTFYKNHFTGKFAAKMPEPRWITLIEHWGYSFRKNQSVWIHCLGNSHPAPIARCFSLTAATAAVKLFFCNVFAMRMEFWTRRLTVANGCGWLPQNKVSGPKRRGE